jgi:hypothetical protein
MQSRELNQQLFKAYPPLGRQFACDHLALLRELPLVLAAILLRQVIVFDTSFPRERAAIERQFAFLSSLTAADLGRLTQGFANLSLSPELVAEDWVQFPQKFEEDLSAYLWASHQIDTFHTLGTEFVDAVLKTTPADTPATPRWTVVILGPELHKEGYPLFRKLLPHGVFFANVNDSDGSETILRHLAKRTAETPVPYGHWYIDGGTPLPIEPGVSAFSWAESSYVRDGLLKKLESVIESGSSGPEMLRSLMAEWTPRDRDARSALAGPLPDPLVDELVLRVYDEGSGTQIYSTTFVQWSTREVLRRAEPVSLVARFRPRQRQRSMNEMFAHAATEMDKAGSLVDADFGAYYTWINLNRLAGSESAVFIAWSESHRQAVAIGPGLPRGTRAPDPITMERLLKIAAPGEASAGA